MMESPRRADKRSVTFLLLTAWLAACAFASCQTGPAETGPRGTTETSTNIVAEHPEQVAPFEDHHLPSIDNNEMHQLHFADGVVCGECHLSTEPLPVDRAHEICADCHPSQPVEKEVWQNHCLSCHYFTNASQEAAGDPLKLGEALCHECHSPEDAGWMLFSACPFKAPQPHTEHVVCTRCHRPHESAEPVQQQVCEECHPEFHDSKHLADKEADCTLCHRPHRAQASGDTLCITCHGQAEDVIVHTIKDHPDDCLACHNAHFVSIPIKGVCADCHEGMVYNGNQYQPADHLDCRNCHNLENFQPKGNRACATCHPEQSSVLDEIHASPEHHNCLNCHPAHTWRVPSSRRCETCHEKRSFFEHDAAFHPDQCLECHDPHSHQHIPPSGDCQGCHDDDRFPNYGPGSPEIHMVCGNCHHDDQIDSGEFGYISSEDSCLLCHWEVETGSGRTWDDLPEGHVYCIGCHEPHTGALLSFDLSCRQCHKNERVAPNEMHRACLNCHSKDHGLEFVGVTESCHLCHGDLPENHTWEDNFQCLDCHDLHE